MPKVNKKQQWARLANTLSKFGILMSEHKATPAYLFMRDRSWRNFWYQRGIGFNEMFTWFNEPTSWAEISQNFPEVHSYIHTENPQWLTGNYNIFFFCYRFN